jgi:hypothetical protein
MNRFFERAEEVECGIMISSESRTHEWAERVTSGTVRSQAYDYDPSTGIVALNIVT